MPTDPRIRQLAEARQRVASENTNGSLPQWDGLTKGAQKIKLQEAEAFLRAAIEVGLVPAAERPTDDHEAVYVDEEGLLYGEYRTSPPSDCLVRLVWANEMAQSKRGMEDDGAEFRLLGWST